MPRRRLPRGTVTFLFTDIEGSTRLAQELGPRWQNILEGHNAVMRSSIRGEGGLDLRTEGDSFFAVFESAAAATSAAVRAQRGLAAGEGADAVRVRMGLHTGEGVPGGDEYVGVEVHRAARIAAAAHGGQVLVSGTTRGLIEHSLPEGVSVRSLGRHRLKDLPHPEELHELVIDGLLIEFPPPRTLEVRTNLPTPLTSFVGRDRELSRIRELLGATRLLTLIGPGGSGKTRLAIEAAATMLRTFPDGVFFVELAAILDPGLVHSTIARSMGVREEPTRSIQASVEDAVRDRGILLVLDNFEQILGAAPMVTDLLRAAPRLKVLVTSRAPLHVGGEQELPVPSLGLPDPRGLRAGEEIRASEAVDLFAQRAAAVAPAFALTDQNVGVVADLCARLDGLPLAIELAASRAKLLSPSDMFDRIQHRLALLTGGARDRPARQRTLRETIAWSYDLLEPVEQRLFARLSTFIGGWMLEAAEAVANPDEDVGLDTLDVLGSLQDSSLIRSESVPGGPRFDMLETIREFGRDVLAESGEEDRIRRRHLSYFLALAETGEPRLLGGDEGWLDRLEREHDNLRAALRWVIQAGEAESGLRIVGALWRFWLMRGHLAEGRRWTDEVLAMPEAAARTVGRARGLSAEAGLAYWQRQPAAAVRGLYEESMAIAMELGDRGAEADAAYNLSFAHQLAGDLDGARELLRRAADLYRGPGDNLNLAFVNTALATVALRRGDREEARALFDEAYRTFRRVGHLWGVIQAAGGRAVLAIWNADFQRARRAALEALDANETLGHKLGISVAIQTLAMVAIHEGRPEVAVRLAGAVDRIREDAGGEAPPTAVGIDDPRDVARALLAEKRIDELFAEGRTMTIDEAVALAREDGPSG
jgi:predicted ATPase/class 3 adenylate cyclase